ncbi:MAG: MauE/DoxX family redox-associated membrane protein [Planctomycetaceae bacterium]
MEFPVAASSAVDRMTVRRLRQVMALFMGLLVWTTRPLWTPGGEFPDIPWFNWGGAIPERLDWLFLMSLSALLILQLIRLPAGRRWPRVLQAALLGGSLMFLPADQHRLQPWVWQMTVGAAVIGISSDERITMKCLRLFTVSIYFWSAVSKIDWAFLEGRGQWLLDGLSNSIGLQREQWSDETRLLLAAALPVGELAVAASLVWPRTRRIGLGMALVMHALLLMALGPWGHRQLPGVLVWNVYFIVQNMLLFGRRGRVCEAEGDVELVRSADPRALLAKLLTGTICLAPALSPWGYWDHWPSWAVYSERPAVVQMFVDSAHAARLPATLQPFVGPPEPLTEWRPVNLDAWSFTTCRCPVYPQLRYRLALISILADRCRLTARIVINGPPNRWTGARVESERMILSSQTAINRP